MRLFSSIHMRLEEYVSLIFWFFYNIIWVSSKFPLNGLSVPFFIFYFFIFILKRSVCLFLVSCSYFEKIRLLTLLISSDVFPQTGTDGASEEDLNLPEMVV